MFRTLLVTSLNERTPPHVVQEIAGHAALYATMTIYAHASTEQRRAALDRLGEHLLAPDLSENPSRVRK